MVPRPEPSRLDLLVLLDPHVVASAYPSNGFIQPCLPTKAPKPLSGALCLHEIKHHGFRVIARKQEARVRLYSRPGNDLAYQFTLIVEPPEHDADHARRTNATTVVASSHGQWLPAHARERHIIPVMRPSAGRLESRAARCDPQRRARYLTGSKFRAGS